MSVYFHLISPEISYYDDEDDFGLNIKLDINVFKEKSITDIINHIYFTIGNLWGIYYYYYYL